jgi:hypothetical protein
VWATRWDGSWPYQVRNGYFYLYDEDEQRVLTDSNLVFSVKTLEGLRLRHGSQRDPPPVLTSKQGKRYFIRRRSARCAPGGTNDRARILAFFLVCAQPYGTVTSCKTTGPSV